MKKYFLSTIILLSAINCHISFGQQQPFSKVLFDDLLFGCTVHAFVPSYNNGYMLAGESSGEGLIVKLDSNANYEWAKKFSSTSRFNDIIKTTDSAFVVVGYSYAGDAICLKLNALGDTIWQTKISGSTSITILEVEQTFDAGFITTGYQEELSAPYSKIFVAKFNSSGSMEWSKYFAGGDNSNTGRSIHQTPDSGYVVCGDIEDFPPYAPATFVAKLNSTGNITWAKKIYDSSLYPGVAYGSDFIITNNGFIFCLPSNSLYLVKTDSALNILWSKKYDNLGSGPSSEEAPLKLHKTGNGDYLFVRGSCWGSAMAKVDSLGNLIFVKGVDMAAIDLTETKDKGFFILGNGPMCGVKTSEYMIPQIGIIKTDSLIQAPMCLFDVLTNVSVDHSLLDTTVVLVSSSGAVASSYQSVLTSVSMFDNDGCVAHASGVSQQDNDKSISIYPNPAVNTVHLESKSSIEFIQLMNLTGKFLYGAAVNASDFDLDMSQYPAGTYFLVLLQDNQLFHKMIVKQ